MLAVFLELPSRRTNSLGSVESDPSYLPVSGKAVWVFGGHIVHYLPMYALAKVRTNSSTS